MKIVFDGRKFAAEAEVKIREKLAGMERKPKLVTIYDPKDEGSAVYTRIKAKKAQELGIDFEALTSADIRILNRDKSVDGIMVQTPLFGEQELINLIDLSKDVDGLREDSPFVPATCRAVLEILKQALQITNHKPQDTNIKVSVVGSNGEVGSRLIPQLALKGFTVYTIYRKNFDTELIKKSDIVISCTGQEGLVTAEMIKPEAICIDVGYPKGDFAPEVAEKAAFITPVPGGVGPVTVAMLFANLAGV